MSELNAGDLQAERRQWRRRRRRNLALVAPLLVFIAFSFLAPLGSMLHRSVYNPTVARLIPATLKALSQWDETASPLPSNEAFSTFARELRHLATERQAGVLAAAINRAYPGASSLINTTARALRSDEDTALAASGAGLLRTMDSRWAEPGLWLSIHQLGQVFTNQYYLTALDLEQGPDGAIQPRTSSQIYLQLYGKTLGMALVITALCMTLGYPLAYYLAHAPRRVSKVLILLVLLPFWTSLLVRTTAWIALLQTNGVINSVLQALGLISQPLEILYTRHATIIAMTHILLPFMVLPLYSVMRGIDPAYVRAAISLGSRPWSAFVRVYFPLTLPGLSAGALLVFIVSVGYYITPALVGGTDGQMISNIIAFHMQSSNNWGLAAALGGLLLVLILLLYWLYDRLVGTRHLRIS